MSIFDQLQSGKVSSDLLPLASKYVDMDNEKHEIEVTSQQMMKQLKQRITRKLRKKNVCNLLIDINSVSELMQPAVFNEKYENYLDDFSELFEQTVRNLIDVHMNKNEILFKLLEKYADLFHHIFDFVRRKPALY
jgi:hypothetical protein